MKKYNKDYPKYRLQDKSLPKAIICDLDGTLALMQDRNPFDGKRCEYDQLNVPVANFIKNYKALGYQILLVSGREDKYRQQTLYFLERYDIPFDKLILRKTKDYRKDAEVKLEIFNDQIKDNYYIEVVLDDRNQVVDLWRKEVHLPCFQVYYGDF